jgi:hypothetical protein
MFCEGKWLRMQGSRVYEIAGKRLHRDYKLESTQFTVGSVSEVRGFVNFLAEQEGISSETPV